MGCVGARDNEKEMIGVSGLQCELLLSELAKNGFTQTVIVQSTIYNYKYEVDQKLWQLRKKSVLFSIDNLISGRLDIKANQRNYHTSQFEALTKSHILLRPVMNNLPSQNIAHQTTFLTAIQKNETFPISIYAKLFSNTQPCLLNLSFNGKFTFLMRINPKNIASIKGFYRFYQIYTIKITQIIKNHQTEFYGLVQMDDDETSFLLKKIILQRNWENISFIEIDQEHQHYQYYNAFQIFNYSDENGRLNNDESQFFAIDPNGKIIRAETAEFYVPQKGDSQILQPNDFDEASSQKSKSLNYEKKLLKEIHILQGLLKNSHKSKTQSFAPVHQNVGLNKYTLLQQSIFNTIDEISPGQYNDFKQLFKSRRLQDILKRQRPGECFQFELIKQKFFNYNTEKLRFELTKCFHILPEIFPAASSAKKKKIHEICRDLKESIGLKWKDINLSIFSIQQEHTFNPVDLMDFLSEYLSNQLKLTFQLFFIKQRMINLGQTIEPSNQIIDNYKVLKHKYVTDDQSIPKKKNLATSSHAIEEYQWIQAPALQGLYFHSQYRISNYPIEIKDIEQLKFIKDFCSNIANEKQTIYYSGVDLNNMALNLMKEYFNNGITYGLQEEMKMIKLMNLVTINNQRINIEFSEELQYIIVIASLIPEQFQLISTLQSQYGFQEKQCLILSHISQGCQQLKDYKIKSIFFDQKWDDDASLNSKEDILSKYFDCLENLKIFNIDKQGKVMKIMNYSDTTKINQIKVNGQESNIKKMKQYLQTQFNFQFQIDDKKWKKIKQDCQQMNININQLDIKAYNKHFQQSSALFAFSSQKIMIWDSHNFEFIELCSDPLSIKNLSLEQLKLIGYEQEQEQEQKFE